RRARRLPRSAAAAFPGGREVGRRSQGRLLALTPDGAMIGHGLQNPAVIAAIAAAGALLCLYGFFRRLRRDRLLADTPLAHIRSAAQGYVKVAGHTRPAGAAATAAPLSGRPCVWWDFKVAEQHRDSRGRTEWQTVESATSVELFVLADADAQCLV